MSAPSVSVRLDGSNGVFAPGDTLSGEYRLEGLARADVKAVELSVLWYTDGKGDEDMAVHHFQRFSAEGDDRIDPRRPVRFSTVLPGSPLSYDGLIVKVRWCVRVRVFLARGKEVVGEMPFRLGDVAAAQIAS